ncbi:MAG TPA: lamin tail domain-containing protein, partial [Anaerolineales bacterium]
PSALNQAVTVAFKVEGPGGAGTPTGSVTVIVETTTNTCSGNLTGGQGQCVLHFAGSGGKILHAEYQGDANFNPGISPSVPHTVLPGPPTATNTLPPGFSVIINEIAWAGTDASAIDQWIELYNVTNSAINLEGWRLRALDGEPNIALKGLIPPRGFFLLERGHDTTVSDIPADQLYNGALSTTVERLYLYNPAGAIADYANTYGTKWLAGSTNGNRSMERRGSIYDSLTTWVTNTGVVRNGKDAHGNPINGTPGRANWATTVTLTPSPRPTIFPSRTLPPQPRPVINEFLPRAAYDWNKDGRVDVFDEFIEVANLGPVDVNLQGWKLDDVANAGSAPFSLPSMVLKPGERAVFYGSQTNILLSDGGDTVRLLSPANVIFDAQTYPVVTVADQTWCRLPDLRGSWYSDCFPTPNLPNQRKGQLPAMPPGTGLEEPLCLLADTLPQEFVLAECRGFGEDMFNARYWDRLAWWSEFFVRQNGSKWETFIQ